MAEILLNEENFDKEVLHSELPVLVDFFATWCGPCRMLLPVIEELADEVKDVKICKVNVDEEPELAQEYKVMTIPTLMVVKGGKVVNTSVGVIPKDEIIKMLE